MSGSAGGRNGERIGAAHTRSRGASSRPSYETPRSRLVTTGLDPVVHAELKPVSAGGLRCAGSASAWIAGSSPAMTNRTNGKERKKKSEAKRRQTQLIFSRALRARPRPQSGGAHLSAFHRGSGLGDRTPPPSFSSALPGMRPPSGFPLSLPVSVQRCFSRTGRNAGRADFPKLPGSGLQSRARAPHSPRAYGLPAAARPNHRARFRSVCNVNSDHFCHAFLNAFRSRFPSQNDGTGPAERDFRRRLTGSRHCGLRSLPGFAGNAMSCAFV
jgi:hypothetical protein